MPLTSYPRGCILVVDTTALLSQYAADVFAGLFDVADATNSRINDVSRQATDITLRLAPMEAEAVTEAALRPARA